MTVDPLVRVGGSAVCPSPDDVAAQLGRFLPGRPTGVEPDTARVDADADGVRVQLMRADGTLVGDKRLPLQASCAEMAEAIGIVLAMWEWPLHPGLVPPVDLSSARRASAALPAATVVAAPEQPIAPPRFRLEAGAGVRALLPGPVPGALIEAVVRHQTRGWGGRVTIGGAWWYSTDVAGGQASWTRVTAGLGLVRGWQGDRWFAEIGAQLLGAALLATGSGFDETRRPVAFDPGVGLGVRSGVMTGRAVRLWAELAVAWWPMRRRLRVDDVTDQVVDVAAFEPSLTIGGSFLTGR